MQKIAGLIFIAGIMIFMQSCRNVDRSSIPDRSPNIIFILADDLGFGDLACYGHPYAKTPHIDNLAREGILFKKFYAAGASCNPSRTALMTSKHPAMFKEKVDVKGFGNQTSVTELLKKEGYVTAHVGKWHIGPVDENGKKPYGFDHIKLRTGKKSQNGKDGKTFDWAIDFVKNNKEQKFYLNIWTHISHFPINPPENMLTYFEDLKVDETKFGNWYNEEKIQVLKNKGKNIDEAMKMFLAEIYSLDHNVGRLLRCLKEEGLEDNTIIIFSSDQGPAPVQLANPKNPDKEAERLYMLGYAGGFRGGKHTFYEGGIRVPFIVKWPGKVPENYVDDESVISGLDFMPTICSILGIEYNKKSMDGEDKSSVWFGVPAKRNSPLFWKRYQDQDITILQNDWKLHKRSNGLIELYNITLDPFEKNEISDVHNDNVNSLLLEINNWENGLPLDDRDHILSRTR